MNDTLKAILKVLTDGKPERQVAAAQILAELKPSEPLVVKALASRLGNGEPHLTRYVLEALAAIGTEDATRALLERLRIGGAESEQIALLMSREENATSARYLASVFDDADLELRCRILSIVGRQNGKEAIAVLRKALLSPEPTLADAALRSLHEVVPRLPGDRRAALTEQIKKDVEHKDIREAPLAYGLRALGVLDPIGARAVLLKFAGPRHPAVVRQAALHALVGVDLTPAQAETLLGYLSEQDMTYVVRPAIAVLARVEKWSAGAVTKLKALLETGTDETRVFALQALRHCKTEAVAGANVVTTDVWASMGQEEEAHARARAFAGYRVDARLMAAADPRAIVLHCLPAHRGEEIDVDVLEGPQSAVFDEAENRLHVQKAILEALL